MPEPRWNCACLPGNAYATAQGRSWLSRMNYPNGRGVGDG